MKTLSVFPDSVFMTSYHYISKFRQRQTYDFQGWRMCLRQMIERPLRHSRKTESSLRVQRENLIHDGI